LHRLYSLEKFVTLTTAVRVPITFQINALLVCTQAFLLYKKRFFIATLFCIKSFKNNIFNIYVLILLDYVSKTSQNFHDFVYFFLGVFYHISHKLQSVPIIYDNNTLFKIILVGFK